MADSERCIACGEIIPEGRMVCPRCEAKPDKGGWISVKDRLPEDGKLVITFKNGLYELAVYEARRHGWISGSWFWSMATVSHWMPLPEPPKEV